MKKIGITVFCLYLVLGMILTVSFGYYSFGTGVLDVFKSFSDYSVTDSIDRLFSSVEGSMKSDFWKNGEYINLYGGIQKAVGRKVVIGSNGTTVFKNQENSLYFGNVSSKIDYSSGTSEKVIERVADFSAFCQNRNVKFSYVIAPCKSAYLDELEFPAVIGLTDYTGSADKTEEALTAKNVPVLNLQRMLHDESSNYASDFFSTDHHWKIETAFWGFQRIGEFLRNDLGCRLDSSLLSSDNYSVKKLKNAMMGSEGARVGKWYHPKDDYALISPLYDTALYRKFEDGYLETRSYEKTGNFDEVVFGELGKNVSYGSYISFDRDCIYVDNLNNNSGEKILLIKDSFAIPVSAWLSCFSDELWIVDLRYQQKESMYDFIENHGIDTVIVMYNPQSFGSLDSMYCFDSVSKGN